MIARAETVIPTNLELWLITVALASSLVLSLVPSLTPTSNHSSPLRFSSALIATLFSAISLAVFVIAVILGWLKQVSIDALAGTVFALVPSLLYIPRTLWRFWSFRSRMSSRVSLVFPRRWFAYVRYLPDHRPGRISKRLTIRIVAVRGDEWEITAKLKNSFRLLFMATQYGIHFQTFRARRDAVDKETEKESEKRTERMRYHLKNSDNDKSFLGSTVSHATIGINSNEPYRGQPYNSVAFGILTEFNENFDVLRDCDNGLTSWWYHAIRTAEALVGNPSLFHVSSETRMINALALLSDIISIGEIVLRHKRDYFKQQLTTPDIRRSLTATPKYVCNKIMNELGFEDWGEINEKIGKEDYEYPVNENREYAILFFVATVKSDTFSDTEKHQRISGQFIINELYLGKDTDDFSALERFLVNHWFEDWIEPGNPKRTEPFLSRSTRRGREPLQRL